MSHSINSTLRFFLAFGIKCALVYVGSVFSKEAFEFYRLDIQIDSIRLYTTETPIIIYDHPVYTPVSLPVILYGCEMWLFSHRGQEIAEEYFEPNGEKVTVKQSRAFLSPSRQIPV
jgi:hypothetical protein